MIKFEDDNPAEKYVVFMDFNTDEGSTLISQVQKDLIDSAEKSGNPTVDFKDGRKIRLSAIKFIKPSETWKSAEQKKEEAKNSHISDLWWKYKHAIQGDKIDVNMSFETYLRTVLKKTDETIEKIKKQARKSGTGIEI